MLTKTDLASHRQCPRKLWLEHHEPAAADPADTTTWRRARDGTIVGEKARERFGPTVIWPQGQSDPESSARRAVEELAAAPDRIGIEVPLFRNGLFARADALIPVPAGYILQETKAATFPLKRDKVSTDKPESHHLEDAAIQAWVYETTAFPLVRVELNLLDNQWRYPGNDDYSGLFRQLDVSHEIAVLVPLVPSWLAEARQTLAGAKPEVHTGKQCESPYPCPFANHCRRLDPPGPEDPIDLLPGVAGKNLARNLRVQRGYQSLLDPSPGELTGKDAMLYRRMQRAHQTRSAVLEPAARDVLARFPYPRYYFDFEGIDLPVPHWRGVRPYEQVPFQFSCHIERTPDNFEHVEFLDLTGNDPSLPCIDAMLRAIPAEGAGPIFVYFKTYEEGRIKELAERHPQHAAALNRYSARLVDLLPIVRDNYYHPAMRGSFSIKKVLPTIAPELDYDALGEVSDGTAAQVAYLHAAFESGITDHRRQELKLKLLAYCKQDTWGMVAVARHLASIGGV
jgi:hypothetical protein